MNKKQEKDRKGPRKSFRLSRECVTSISGIVKRGDARTATEAIEKSVEKYDKRERWDKIQKASDNLEGPG